ncbi:hypothetical protein BD311DRAFT_755720 [Dichomitus squalens]|uniref:Uncharacterized protein n=1 Tax=Dichomitus squalens TaxID=114155 RepID=A0A4Q9MT91_9APHY|nr:hypothetical protein BD311DRAFT_755720 [Dichomitus squalens]
MATMRSQPLSGYSAATLGVKPTSPPTNPPTLMSGSSLPHSGDSTAPYYLKLDFIPSGHHSWHG